MSKIFEALQRAEKQAKGAPPPLESELPGMEVGVPAEPQGLIGALPDEPEPLPGPTPAEPPIALPDPAVEPVNAAAMEAELRRVAAARAIVAREPASLAAEQYRVLRTNLFKLRETQPLQVVLISSPAPGDGKTVTALNLAFSFAQKPSTRVLLIEGDLRRPALLSLLKVETGPGLLEYLSEVAELDQVIRPAPFPGLYMLGSGQTGFRPSGGSTAADLLHSPRLGDLIRTVRAQFDWVVVDGPPVALLADHELLSMHADGVLLIVRPQHTPREMMDAAMEAVDPKKMLGAVINAAPSSRRYAGYYGYYGYGYGSTNGHGKNGPQGGSGTQE